MSSKSKNVWFKVAVFFSSLFLVIILIMALYFIAIFSTDPSNRNLGYFLNDQFYISLASNLIASILFLLAFLVYDTIKDVQEEQPQNLPADLKEIIRQEIAKSTAEILTTNLGLIRAKDAEDGFPTEDRTWKIVEEEMDYEYIDSNFKNILVSRILTLEALNNNLNQFTTFYYWSGSSAPLVPKGYIIVAGKRQEIKIYQGARVTRWNTCTLDLPGYYNKGDQIKLILEWEKCQDKLLAATHIYSEIPNTDSRMLLKVTFPAILAEKLLYIHKKATTTNTRILKFSENILQSPATINENSVTYEYRLDSRENNLYYEIEWKFKNP